MKLFSPFSKVILAFAASVVLLTGCKDDEDPGGDPQEVISITAIDPTSGPVGTVVEIQGQNFGSALSDHVVTFNGTEAEITSVTNNRIVATVPAAATTGQVSLTTLGQTVNGPTFTVTPDTSEQVVPEITGLDPTEGTPGTTVRVVGNGFGNEMTDHVITFNGVEATITSVTNTEITVTVPEDATTGLVELTLGGETYEGPEFMVIEEGPVANLNPTRGVPGMTVFVIGSGFGTEASDLTLYFNEVEAEITNVKDNEIRAIVPEGATTGRVSLEMNGETYMGPTFTVLITEELEEEVAFAEGFDMDAGIVAKGSAYLYASGGTEESTILRLTPGAANREGTAFYGTRVPVEGGFETTFDFRISRPGKPEGSDAVETGAEGFAFVIQNQALDADGFSGASMGYAGIENGIAIEFDIYQNRENEQNMLDPNGNHISVQANTANPTGPIRAENYHSLGHTTYQTNPDLPEFIGNETSRHTARIVYNPEPGMLQIYVNDMETPALEVEMNITDYINLSEGKAYVGFTSATSAWGWAASDILNWEYVPGSNE